MVCIGDSVTQGRGDRAKGGSEWIPTQSWRWAFWKKALDAGIDIQFVGTLTEGFESTPSYEDYKGKVFENRHEARWGKTTEHAREAVAQSSTQWIADVALVYLGGNAEKLSDDEKNTDPHGVRRSAAAMRGLVEVLRSNNPNMALLIRRINGEGERESGLNEAFEEIASECNHLDAPAATVEVPSDWQWDPKEPGTDTIDGSHPNPQGDEKNAAAFFNQFLAINEPARREIC